ncbi:MAG: alpha/beta fold hydrolase [Sphingorhabdus sp.]
MTNEPSPPIRHGKAYTQYGGPIHYRMAGSGSPLLLIHGWMGTSYSWRKVMPLLTDHFTVIPPDCRGYPDSLVTAAQIRESTTEKISCPVLTMNGQFGHPGVTEQMDLVATDVTGHTIPWCGHLLAEEYPEQVADAIRGRFA